MAAVKLHIVKTGKSEIIAKALGEIKAAPHFVLWKKYTRPQVVTPRKREWTI